MTASESPDPVRARRVDHVAFATSDADAAARWYETRLGMTVVGDERVESAGVRLVYLAPHDQDPDTATMIQLAEPFAEGAVATHLRTRGEGFHHVCLTVDDIDEVLEAAGQDRGTIFLGGRERRACFLLEQPQGVLIELTETHTTHERTPA